MKAETGIPTRWVRPANVQPANLRLILVLLLGLLPLCGAAAQEDEPVDAAETADEERTEAALPEAAPPQERVEPVFPPENRDLIFVEGEDAVSTNFDQEPVREFSASGSRTLQLSRTTDLQGGAAFFADFVFYVEEPGTYELWYGGTPPGPREELYPAYVSPIRTSLDGEEPVDVYREDVAVVDRYTPVYYWNLVGERQLAAGRHTLRFLVESKRNYDGRYLFYLDCFFLVRTAEGTRLIHDPLPAVFPLDLGNRSMDYPFRAVEDYEIVIRNDPENADAYVELSYVYSLVGDHLNALKYVRRAVALDPDNPSLLLLQAKNRIWKGDVQEGLDGYWDLLVLDPDRLDLWMEAGKVAAWTGRHGESVAFFEAGLQRFPDSLELLVNLGLTHLWSVQERQAEETFRQARELAGDDAAKLISLGRAFEVNGYPQRAAELYRETIRHHPEYLEAYLLLQNMYFRSEESEKIDEVSRRIEAVFRPSERLTRTLELYDEKRGMKLQVMEEYEMRLAENPDNLALRETLAQTYFWNGFRNRGIEEYRDILLNHAFRSSRRCAEDSAALMQLMDASHIYAALFEGIPSEAQKAAGDVEEALARYRSASKSLEAFLEEVDAARNRGEELPTPEGEDPADVVDRTADELAKSYRRARGLLDAYGELVESFEADYVSPTGALAEAAEEEAADQEAFQNVIRINRWRWDQDAFTAELEPMSDQLLARYVLARIALSGGRFAASERLFALDDLSTPLAADFQYGLFQAKLWQGRTQEALVLLEETSTDLVGAVPYLSTLDSLAGSLLGNAPKLPADLDEPAIRQILVDLEELRKEAPDRLDTVETRQNALMALIADRVERALYHLEENTYLTRRELGDYYQAEEELEAAIAQYRRVLAIDPWDLGTVYRLGNVYEWSGDWRQAMRNYERIYFQDPGYENAAALYNRLARSHADTTAFSTFALADTSRISMETAASLHHPLGTHLGWKLLYRGSGSRIYKPPSGENASTYRTQTLSTGFPLEFAAREPDAWVRKLTLEPQAGVVLWNDLVGDRDGLTEEIPITEYLLEHTRIEPILALPASLTLGDYLYLGGQLHYRRQEETFSPERAAVNVLSGELSLNTNLSFIEIYPFRSSSMRTYGKVAGSTDGNWLFEGLQELTFGLLAVEEPYARLSLTARALFQDSVLDVGDDYYSPQGVLVAGGGVLGSLWLPVGEENGLGLSLRLSGAYFGEELFDIGAPTAGSPVHRAQLEGELGVEYSRGEAVYFLSAQLLATYRFTQPIPTTAWDYWLAAVRMGFNARLPRLLAP